MPEEAAAHKERKGEEGTEVRDSSRNGLYWEINVRFGGCFVKIRIANINRDPF